MSEELSLDRYRLLGRSGLRVSPLALGTMTFGQDWGWGADKEESRLIFDAYVDRGGNFIDTANQYTQGTSERLVGAFSVGRRDSLVIATKYTLPESLNDPNSGGNHRKSMVRSVEASLRRLSTDYIDLLYLHAWDFTTSVEEVSRAMDDLVRTGKVLYLGISDTPAWQISRMQTIADLRGWCPFVALQAPYNLIERSVERELLPMAIEMGLGLIPWSPLAGGILTGKHGKLDPVITAEHSVQSSLRKDLLKDIGDLSDRNLALAAVATGVAKEIGISPAQVALAWLLRKSGVACPIIGARTLSQFLENIAALGAPLTEAHEKRLDDASAIDLGFPHDYLARWVSRIFRPWKIDLRT